MQTFGQAFDPRDNGLNLLRTGLALLVLVSHSWPLSGAGEDPVIGDLNLGRWAVAAFFVISGYLITGSRMADRSTARYLRRRVLRIYPGYWVLLVFIAGVAGPVAWTSDGRELAAYGTTSPGPADYVLSNLTLVPVSPTIGTTLEAVPYPNAFAGSLWSLPFEFACYLLVGVVGAYALRRGRNWPISVTAACFAALNLANHTVLPTGESYVVSRFLDFGLLFFCGATLWIVRERLPATWWLAILAMGWLATAAAVGLTLLIAGPALAYLCMYAAVRLPHSCRRLGRRRDISYGLYLYGFPVQQVLASFDAQRWGVWAFVVLSIAATAPLAYASQVFVEGPAQRWKGRRPAVRPDDGPLDLAGGSTPAAGSPRPAEHSSLSTR